MSNPNPDVKSPRRRKLIIGSAIVALLVGAFVVPAFAGSRDRGAKATPAQVYENMQRVADFVLDELDATDAQKKRAYAILKPLATDFANAKNEGRALKQSIVTTMTKRNPDPKVVEQLRKEGLALADKVSAKGIGALLEIEKLLTDEQHGEMVEKLQRLHKLRGR